MKIEQLSGFFRQRGMALLTLAALMALAACQPPGRKLLKMEIYQNDQLVLRTLIDAPDSEAVADLWKRTGTEPAGTDKEVAKLTPDEDDRLRATLKGAIKIRLVHATAPLSSASLTDLELVRKTPESQAWYLPPKEIKRASKAAGF